MMPTLMVTQQQTTNTTNHQQKTHIKQHRVVLLLDLDSFYAQCECVRLGWDATKTALALLQWNSVLAVTYPAREWFGIKRGDTWETIQQKVEAVVVAAKQQKEKEENHENKTNNQDTTTTTTTKIPNQCYAVSVPILTTDGSSIAGTTTTTTTTTKHTAQSPRTSNDNNDESSSNNINNNNDNNTTTTTDWFEYERIFQLSAEEQLRARRADVGKRRFYLKAKHRLNDIE